MTRSLSKTADYFEQILKNASAYPTVDKVKDVVKKTIENLIAVHPDVMQGVLYASNVNLQSTIEDMFVSFLLNVSDDPKFQDTLANNKPSREALVNSAVKGTLELNFREFQFRVHFSEFPTKKPGWFEKTPE
ncbi:MAG TPA: hypothetical protein VM577_18635 [Anaerovoracaceae bacterium]|nr:hypothetical protein [Anaerovoracaceae bacterium]